MGNVQDLLLLLIAAAVLVRLADGIHLPSPIVLVVGGLVIALIPGMPRIELPPEAVFLFFLPPLVHSAGWYTSPRELRAIVAPLAALAILLVLLTTAALAAVAHALVPGLGWGAAAVLGAVLAPTDAVAATATFGRLGAPERLRLLVEGESMINDGTALVLYRVAVGAAAGGAVTAQGAVLQFLGNTAGGVVVGLAVGLAIAWIIERQTDAPLVIIITLLGAYGAYIGAEEINASGIIAAVVAGLTTGWRSPRVMDADTRLTGVAFWRVLVFGLEITLFVLLGLQLPTITAALGDSSSSVGQLIVPAAALTATAIAVRMACVFTLGTEAGETAGERFIVGWSGMRGAVSLAAALAVPLAIADRPQIIFLTFAVILATLVGQGLTLPLLLRKLKLPDERPWSEEEASARMEAAQAALDRLDELEEEEALSETQLERLRDAYRRRFRVCLAVLGGDTPGDAQREQRLVDYSRYRRELIGVEREAVLGLRSQGRLSNRTMRQIQHDLDLEEARLRA